MLLFLLFFSRFLVNISSLSLQPRSLNVAVCRNQSEYRWIVSIQLNNNHTCNGLILDQKSILTTALCCKEKLNCTSTGPNPHIKVVHVSETNTGFPKGEQCSIARVERCIIHSRYVRGPYYIEYDTAIMFLKDNLIPHVIAPLSEGKWGGEFSEECTNAMVTGYWFHLKDKMPDSFVECFPVTIKHLKKCAEVSTFVYLKQSHNHTLTCSYDASNRYEVCTGFYGAALTCGGKVVGMVSHKFNFSERCDEVSPFYYSRIDWSYDFRNDHKKGRYGRSVPFDIRGGGSIQEVHFVMVFFLTLCNVVSNSWGSRKL